ncbi:MAG: T9SS type A sorting domain-containing protein [Bacteroidetes bacterium]|nr:T9SS type A sorting domain-containing protein [Bacteroidota bacterium]
MKTLYTALFLLLITLSLSAQPVDVPKLRSDGLGTQVNRKESTMNANNLSTLFYNNGEIAQWPYTPSLEWPKGSGINYLDGFYFIVTAAIDSIQSPSNRTKFNRITPVQTYYREEMDWTAGVPAALMNENWGFNPVSGYKSPMFNGIANNQQSDSWPSSWPAALGWQESKNGTWVSGSFPFSIQPDLEAFYVVDDSKDAEWTKLPNAFYPILADSPAVFTDSKQWFNPDIRKGLGLRVESRLYQWNIHGIDDALFGTHEVINLSDRDYDSASIGFYIDSGFKSSVDSGDEYVFFLKDLNAVWWYDKDGIVPGKPDVTLGVLGFVLLETPGNRLNNVDDDDDGLTDETQTDGIDNDADWLISRDDVGKDGIVGTSDMGEGDGLPTQGEPNFDLTDPDEADQNGMRGVHFSQITGKTVRDLWPRNDGVVFNYMADSTPDTSLNSSNIQVLVSNGLFNFQKGFREKIAYALIMANTKEELIEKIKTAQYFYNSGYRYKTVADDVEETEKVSSFSLDQNYPNPFNPATTITYSIGKSGSATLVLYNQLGQKIRVLDSGNKPAGQHSITANLENLPSGIYFYSLEAEGFRQTRKLVLVK